MKKIFTKKQLLNEKVVEYDPQHPERMHPSIERQLSDKSHPLGGHPAFPPSVGGQSFEEKIASQRFKDVVSKVKRYSGSERIMQIERAHKDELQKLAVKLVKKEFGLKDQIDLLPKITDDINLSGTKIEAPEMESPEEPEKQPEAPQSQDYDAEDISDLENAEEEVKKRRLVNALIQGASKKGHYMFHLVEDELNRIDPRLVNLYGLIMSIGDFQYWMIDDETIRGVIEQSKVGKVTTGRKGDQNDPRKEEDQEDGGKNKKKKYVKAEGKIFPVVVHELIKGVMEVMSLPSLPKDPKLREYVLSKADFVMAENWDLRLGPGIWEKFLDSIGESGWEVKNHLYNKIMKMPTSEFNSFMREVLGGTQKGKRELAELAGEIKRDIVADQYDKSEYERKKSEIEKSSKQTEDDFMKQIRDMLKPRRPDDDNF